MYERCYVQALDTEVGCSARSKHEALTISQYNLELDIRFIDKIYFIFFVSLLAFYFICQNGGKNKHMRTLTRLPEVV